MALQSIKFYEGLRLCKYQDTTGHATIGYGHLLLPGDAGRLDDNGCITQDQADAWYEQDYVTAQHGAESLVDSWSDLDPVAQDCLINMVYNMGVNGVGEFSTFLDLLTNHKYNEAGEDLEHTLWRMQVGRRATDIINALTGISG